MFIKKYKTQVFLVGLLLLSLVPRLWKLGEVPSVLNRDEAALGYNALLLSQTGTDEWGKSWPVALESFGDFKLLGYPAILAGLFSIFEPSDFLVKLPSALAGVGLVFIGLLWAYRLTNSRSISFFVGVLLAVNPVFIFYSRIGFEANVGLFLFTTTLLLLFSNWGKNQNKLDLLAFLTALLAVVTYNTPLLLLPFVILFLPLYRGLKNWRSWIVPVAGLSLITVVFLSLLSDLTAQKSGITIFSDASVHDAWVSFNSELSPILAKLIGGKKIFLSGLVIKNILNSFSWQFLVSKGGTHPWHAVPGWGHLFSATYILGLFGAVVSMAKILQALLKKNIKKVKQTLLLLFLLLISLAPSAVTVDSPHATRSLVFFVLVVVFAALGLEKLLEILSKRKLSAPFRLSCFSPQAAWVLVLVTLIFSSTSYLNNYFSVYSKQEREILQAGLPAVLEDIEKNFPDERVAFVDPSGYHYILVSWYLRLPPDRYFQTVVRQQPDTIGFKYGEQVDRYHFIVSPEDRAPEEKVLIEWRDGGWFSKKY